MPLDDIVNELAAVQLPPVLELRFEEQLDIASQLRRMFGWVNEHMRLENINFTGRQQYQ